MGRSVPPVLSIAVLHVETINAKSSKEKIIATVQRIVFAETGNAIHRKWKTKSTVPRTV